MKALMSVIIATGLFLAAVIAVLAFSRPALADGCKHHDCKTNTTTTVIVKEDNDEWKYVVGTAIVTCAAISIYRQTWCWEKTKPTPLPNPGPAPNDVTPVNPAKVKLYQ